MRKNITLLLVLVSTLALVAQNKVGTTAAPFLGIGPSPRAIGMGGAFVAVANDPSALYWNPAGISRNARTEVLVEHTNYLIGTSYNYFAGVVALDQDNAIGVSVTNLAYGTDIVTTVDFPDGTGETWSASDWALGVSYSRNLTDRFSIGGSAKMIMQKIWRESATGFALDAGLLYITSFNDLKIGMNIANFGTDMQLDGEDLFMSHDPNPTMKGNNKKIPAEYHTATFPLPILFRLGLSMDVLKSRDTRFTVAVDALHPGDNAQSVNVGCEYVWDNLVAARVGYRSLGLPNKEGGLTAGVGLSYDLAINLTLKIDYAYEDFGRLQNIQKFALSVAF